MKPTDEQLAHAVHNNALWCDTVCRAHGAPGEFHDALWLSRRPSPPFYPNAVTLRGAAAAAEQRASIGALAAELPGGFGVKDSFCALDLAPLGFAPLFEATWLWRPAGLAPPPHRQSGVTWSTVTSAAELAEWEAAWAGADGPDRRIFPPSLLGDPALVFVAARWGRAIVAGAVGSHSGAVAGISNVFVPHGYERLRAGCVAAVAAAFPGLPLVGYEAGHDLSATLALGFAPLGSLRVWQHRGQA